MIMRIIFSLLLGFTSAAALAASSKPIQIADNAPDSYTVQRGDTLWGISGKFLKEPWRWPEVWRMNRDQIRNPHLIYPGQIVVLDRNGPRLSIARPIRMKPQIYDEKLQQAIPSIPTAEIAPFLSQPLVVDEAGMSDAAKIIATDESRVLVGAGNKIYATNIQPGIPMWQIYRPTKPVIDPGTNELLGYEAYYLGTARTLAEGEPATLEVTRSVEEIGKGDRMVPAAKPDLLAYSPHAPDKDIKGEIIGIYSGVGEAGANSIVTLNLGTRNDIEVGHVLAIYRAGREETYREDGGRREIYTLPEERYGLAFVFRTFEKMSYALIMSSSRPVTARDVVRTP